MRTVDSRTLARSGWAQTLDRVRAGESLAILQRGKPAAVLLPFSVWERAASADPASEGEEAYPVPETAQQTYGSHEVRDNLRERREDSTFRNLHTLITWHGKQHSAPAPEVVMAPWDWTRKALPTLGDIEPDAK
ncbi:type II toxin-antitoxin system Phd/YefM family antitoxin [Nocardia salmonicida]|uniref:type II toxin-antitoxin system Phd/YefM family antitoxin n=1 Tax=Nocardia salmonicida TaxID=53431 RepID=UPI0037A72AA6